MDEELEQGALDAAWSGEEPDTAEDAPGASAQGPAADQPGQENAGAAGGTEGGQSPADQPGQEGGQPPADQPGGGETFTLKNRDQVRTVGRDEVIAMAQKGWDYDTVRADRDRLMDYQKETEPMVAAMRSWAQRAGMSLEQYMDYVREEELKANGVAPETAKAQVAMEKRQADLDARERAAAEEKTRQEAQAREAAEREAARQKDFNAFLAAYPEVKPEDIPKAVWERVGAGESLVTAYTMERNRELTVRLAALEQNERNRERSPGSMSTRGDKGKSSLEELWDQAEV